MADKVNRYTDTLTLATGQTVSAIKVSLPFSGETIFLRRGKGRDRIAAGNMVQNKENPFEFAHAMLAQVAYHEDSQPVRVEELAEMDEDDLDALIDARTGEDAVPSQGTKG